MGRSNNKPTRCLKQLWSELIYDNGIPRATKAARGIRDAIKVISTTTLEKTPCRGELLFPPFYGRLKTQLRPGTTEIGIISLGTSRVSSC